MQRLLKQDKGLEKFLRKLVIIQSEKDWETLEKFKKELVEMTKL